MSVTKKATASLFGSLLILGAIATPSQASPSIVGDSLVVVQVGDITITDAVDVNVAASVAATVCALVDADVLVLAQQVDATGKKEIVCKTGAGPVKIVNNK